MLEEDRFGNVLASLRKRRGKAWTQKKTADLLGVSERTYKGWENGERIPSDEYRKAIAAAFELNESDEAMFYQAAAQVPPRIHNLPFPPNLFFTGRTTQLERISQLLQETGSVVLTQPVSISGLGGVGKTQLALEYAHRAYHEKKYRAVFWIDAADKATIEASYTLLVRLLALSEKDAPGTDHIVRSVNHWLEGHTNWLLIMDNADDLLLARSFFPVGHQGHILLTTRSQIVGNIARPVEVEELRTEEGLLFILRRSGILQGAAQPDTVASDIRAAATQLVELLGRHPLALDQAGAYIEETGVSFTDYIDLYDEERRFLLRRRGSLGGDYSEHPETVAATFELSLTKAREHHPLASDILHFCAFLQPDAIPEELLLGNDSFAPSTAFNEAITALRRYSLIKRNAQEKTLSMHRLVQTVLVDSMDANLQLYWKECVGQRLNAYFPRSDFRSGNWPLCDRYLSNVITHASWTEDDPTPAIEVGELYFKAGSYVLSRWWDSLAEDLLPRAHASFAQHFGDWHPKTMQVLATLALLYMMQGKDGEAGILLPQLISAQTEQLGSTHPDTISSMQSMANLYIQLGAYEQAEKIVNQLSDLMEDRWEYDYLLANIFWHQGKYEQAEPLFRQLLDILEKNYTVDDFRIPSILYALAVCLILRWEHKEAKLLFERALHIDERLYGASRPEFKEVRETIAMLQAAIELGSTDHAPEPNDKLPD